MTTNPLSECCKAVIKEFELPEERGTYAYVCSNCGKACDEGSVKDINVTRKGWEERFDELAKENIGDMFEGVYDKFPIKEKLIIANNRFKSLISQEIESVTYCQRNVQNGTAICGVKLDCHLHDWRETRLTLLNAVRKEERERVVKELHARAMSCYDGEEDINNGVALVVGQIFDYAKENGINLNDEKHEI